MQRASLLSRSDRILVYPGRRTASGLWLSVEPYLVLPYGSAPEEIGSAVLRALGLSHGIEPDPSDWKSLSHPRLAAAAVKSEAAFQKGSKLVLIERHVDRTLFKPTHNGGTRGESKGFNELEGEVSSLSRSATPASVGAAALASVLRCTSAARPCTRAGCPARDSSSWSRRHRSETARSPWYYRRARA